MSSVEQQMAADSNEIRPVGGKMRAIVQTSTQDSRRVAARGDRSAQDRR